MNILGLESLEDRREFLCLQYAKNNLKNEKINYLFPKNTKIHQMDTRNKEIFNVNNANTARLQQSPIIYMQNLLNQNAKNNI